MEEKIMKPWEKYQTQSTQADPLEAALELEGITGQQADIARSIYMQESGGGRNTKTSNAGARGGMQIIPATFNRMADKGWAIDDPVQNARAGVRYINALYTKADGDPALTAAGYYGGEGAINKAKRGIAVSDPRNPKAPNTLQYGEQVAARLPKQEAVTTGKPWEKYAQVEQQQAQPAPVDGYTQTAQSDSVVDNVAAGIGGGMTGLYLGAKDMLGMADEQEVQEYKQSMKGLSSTVGGFVGDIVGQAVPMVAGGAGLFGAGVRYIPKVAQMATTLGGRTALAGAGGATQGAFIPTTQDENRAGNMLLSAGIGAGANRILERGARAVNAFLMKKSTPQPVKMDNFVTVQIDNYLANQGVDISKLSEAAKNKARQFAQQSMQSGDAANPSVNAAVLESLPVPMQGTKGQIGQDYVQQDSERVLADTFWGSKLKQRFEQQQGQLGKNLDVMINDQTKGVTSSAKETGESLQGEALKRYNKAKAATSTAYKDAEATAGANIGKPSDNLIKWLEQNKGFQDVGGVVTKAKELGIIKVNKQGRLIAGDAPLRNFYELRKDVSRLSKNNGAFADAKRMVDDTFDAYGGDAYRTAATLRKEQGVTFESGAKSVRDLVAVKNGTTDQVINREDVFDKVVIKGNRDDIRNIKKLLYSGERSERVAGKQQVENLKKQTLQFFKDESFIEESGKSGFKLHKFESAYKKIGEENLEEILGKAGKKQLDDFMKAAVIINRKQPSSAGGSQTAARLANMLGSILKVVEKVPVVGKPLAVTGEVVVKSSQASGALENPMKAVTKKVIAQKADKLAGRLARSKTGLTFNALAVAGGGKLREE